MLFVLQITVAAAFLALALATRIPLLAIVALVYGIVAWAARPRDTPRSSRRRATILTGVFAVAGAAVAAGIGYLWWMGDPPVPDAFYDAPAGAPARPGVLLRQEPFSRALPAGSRAWRILYTTTRAANVSAVASAIVLAPALTPPGPRHVVAWTHGTTGAAPGCAPSVLPPPFPFDATVPAVSELIAQGWVLVGTDYVGLGTPGPHPYLIGDDEARSALDAIRAAKALRELTLDGRVVVWGHSQGGHAALWTGMQAPSYAADVELAGVAALAPATDIGALVDAAQQTPVGKIMGSFVMTAYSQTYPDVRFEHYVRPRARARAMAARCLSGPGALLSVLTALTVESDFFGSPPNSGPLADRFRQNRPQGRITAPLLIAQGLADDLVLPAIQEKYVRERCDAGQKIDYRTYEGRDHVGVVAADSALIEDLVQWTSDRFAGLRGLEECRTVAR